MPDGPALALVPARMGSKGVPGKNLRRIGGVSLTALAVRCAQATGLFDRVVVSTDGADIAAEGKSAGADIIMRPADLASDEADVLDVIAHTLDVLAAEHRFTPAVVGLLEPSSPLRTPDMVKAAVAALGDAEAVFTASAVPRRFHGLKQFQIDEDGYAHRVLRDLPMPVRRQELGTTFVQDGAVYVFRTSMFRAHHSVFGPKPRALASTGRLVNIDTLEDLAEAERLVRERGLRSSEPAAPPAADMAGRFAKYRERQAYHWREASLHPIHGWPYTRSRMAWVARQCAASRSILEIGCGDGALLACLARKGTSVVGVDLEETAIELAGRMFKQRRLRGEFFTDLKAVDGRRFDAVVLAEVIEHLDDPEAMLARVVGLLSPHGRLVLTTPIRLLERSLDVHHVHEFWPDELRALVGRYFESVETVRMHPAWLIDLMCRGIGRIRPVAVLANLVRLGTGIELLDRFGSPLSIYWTQGIVATNARRERQA